VYEHFFGLRAKPFALTPDARFLYPSHAHGMALTMLEYGLESHAPLLLLTGEIGSGKTTLVRRFLDDLGERCAIGLISQAHRRVPSILGWALSALEIAPADDSDIAMREALVDACVREYGRGRRTLLVVDEAQNLSPDVLEELRLLLNVNADEDLVLQILLVGQPELRETLRGPGLRQLAQRVAADYHLRPLGPEETAGYVRHRLSVAGGSPKTFRADALEFVHAATGGVPRLVNQLCDMGLVYAYSGQQRFVDARLLRQVLSDREAVGALPVFVTTGGAPASRA
jgi:type II secretory pathway predicted ATPase ExeA